MLGAFEIDLRFESEDRASDLFEEFLDTVTDELAKIGIDADYTAALSDLTATWVIDVPDASEDSLISALTSLRTALHAAGCVTATWPVTHEVVAARHLAVA